ncbi:uncharacterized protein LOC129612543 [Condylostylus longicornis]|uniref:uncharacterized protein LOC129612543 n=1 Tax=Condylostylus longicornis TaxID=2530218 RepID=UPI00244DC8AC|nr:uncharacterized protein LOC129612543 [Condylostylus longicornis]
MVQPNPIEPKKKKNYVIPQIKLRKISFWTKVTDKVEILLCNLKISRLTPIQANRERKVAPEMCIVAPIYCKLSQKPIKFWLPCFLDKIKEIGNELHMKTKLSLKIQETRIRPNSVYPKFIVDFNKIEIFIGESCLFGENINSLDLNTMEKFIKENDSIILMTANNRFIAFWNTEKIFLCYSPTQGFEREDRIMNRVADKDTIITADKDVVLEENDENVIEPGPPMEMNDIDRSNDIFKIPFSKDYVNEYYNDRGFLSGTIGLYVKDPEKIIISNIAAAIYLHNIRSVLWNKKTINDILSFGDQLYGQSIKTGIVNDIYWVNRIPQPITFGAKQYKLIFEKVIIGDIMTEENFIYSIKQGISAFFKHSDLGIIYGPQPQLIWQEAGLYFTFSPKERDPIGRKWTRALSSSLAGDVDFNELPQQGSACVSWFKSKISLSDAYLANITLKHRKDQYRIIRIKISEIQDTSINMKNWKSYAPGKWRVIGDKNICHYIQNSKGGLAEIFPKSFTIACVNSLYTKNLKRTFILGGKRFQIVVAANKYQGQVFYNKSNSPDLATDKIKYNLKYKIIPLKDSENIYSDVYGHAFALRFKDISTMYEEILTIMSLNDDEKYSLYIVEGKDRPPLLNYKQFGENAAILHPNGDLHEGSDVFNVRADKQTYANILIALCYVNISRPLEWSPEDVADLLQIGDSIYCKIIANLKDCSELYYKLKLEDITPNIGCNKFNYTVTSIEGIFKIYAFPEAEEEEGEHEIEDEENEKSDVHTIAERSFRVLPQLEQILNEWEEFEQIQAILDSRIIKLGLWKKDLVYFIFDPKASLPDGKMTPRRIQRAATTIEYGENDITDLRYVENNGISYVAYFYDITSFVSHILSCIPQDYHSENFTLHKLKIICPPVPASEMVIKYMPNTNFIITAPNIGIIRGTISQDEVMFQNPNKQEIANCMVAIAFAFITPSNNWTCDLINIILKYGDRLYVKSLDRYEKQNCESISMNNKLRSLTIENIIENINIYKILFKFTVVGKITNCINPGCESNKDIKKFFARLQNIDNGWGAIINIKDRTNTVWKQGTLFFLFDPFKCDPVGFSATNGVSCLMRFNKFELFMEFFIKKYLCKDGPNNFEIITIFCEKSMPPSIPGFYLDKYNFALQKPTNQIVFEDTEKGMKTLKRFIDFTNKSIRFLCLASLLYSRVEYVELWNFYVFERIILLAEFLQQQLYRKTSIPNNNHLEDINFSVKIDKILYNIVVHHIIQVSPATEIESKNLNMRQGLQSFFLNHNYCIITSDNKSYAIWNEGPKFYMVWFRENDSKLILLISPNWMNFYDIILEEMDSNSPTYYIKKVIITRIKIMDINCNENENKNSKTNIKSLDDDLDEKCRECAFTKFIEEYMTRNEIKNKMNANFKPYCRGVNVICGDLIRTNEFIYSDRLFCEYLKACCVTSAAMFLIFQPATWDKSTLNEIVSTGMDLFKSYGAFNKKTQFDIIDYQSNMNFLNYNVCIKAEIPTEENFELNSILEPLEHCLKKSKIAYIGVEELFYVTIMLDEQYNYMFYGGAAPSSIQDIENETSCLIRADSLQKLIEFLMGKCKIKRSVFIGQINARFL